MTGGVEDGDFQPRQMQGVSFAIGFGIVQSPGGHHGRQGQVIGANVDSAAGLGGDGFYTAHMVKVPVGQQNGLHRQTQFVRRVQHLLRLIAGVDDTAGFAVRLMDDVAVGLISAQSEGMDFQHRIPPQKSRGRLPRRPVSRRLTI